MALGQATIPTASGFSTGKAHNTPEKGGADPYLRRSGGIKQRVGRIMNSRRSANGTPLSPVPPNGSPMGGSR